MLHTLLESGPRARSNPRRLLLSVSIHAMVIAGAIALSRQPAHTVASSRPQQSLVFIPPQIHREAPSAPSDRSPLRPAPAPLLEPLPDVPDLIPPILATTLLGVADLLRDAALPPGSTPALSGPLAGGTSPIAANEPWTASSVDDPVAIIEQPSVQYPPALARAGITGRVELEYVVDTLGRAEPGSLRAMTATRPEFEAVARESVLRSRYRPARLRGHPVRQLVHQTLSFRAKR